MLIVVLKNIFILNSYLILLKKVVFITGKKLNNKKNKSESEVTIHNFFNCSLSTFSKILAYGDFSFSF